MQYIVSEDISWGYIPNAAPPKLNFIAKKGDRVSGTPERIFIYNRNVWGIKTYPPIPTAYLTATDDGKIFIELRQLTKLDGSPALLPNGEPAPDSAASATLSKLDKMPKWVWFVIIFIIIMAFLQNQNNNK